MFLYQQTALENAVRAVCQKAAREVGGLTPSCDMGDTVNGQDLVSYAVGQSGIPGDLPGLVWYDLAILEGDC